MKIEDYIGSVLSTSNVAAEGDLTSSFLPEIMIRDERLRSYISNAELQFWGILSIYPVVSSIFGAGDQKEELNGDGMISAKTFIPSFKDFVSIEKEKDKFPNQAVMACSVMYDKEETKLVIAKIKLNSEFVKKYNDIFKAQFNALAFGKEAEFVGLRYRFYCGVYDPESSSVNTDRYSENTPEVLRKYSFAMPSQMMCPFLLKDEITDKPVGSTHLNLYAAMSKVLAVLNTNLNGWRYAGTRELATPVIVPVGAAKPERGAVVPAAQRVVNYKVTDFIRTDAIFDYINGNNVISLMRDYIFNPKSQLGYIGNLLAKYTSHGGPVEPGTKGKLRIDLSTSFIANALIIEKPNIIFPNIEFVATLNSQTNTIEFAQGDDGFDVVFLGPGFTTADKNASIAKAIKDNSKFFHRPDGSTVPLNYIVYFVFTELSLIGGVNVVGRATSVALVPAAVGS